MALTFYNYPTRKAPQNYGLPSPGYSYTATSAAGGSSLPSIPLPGQFPGSNLAYPSPRPASPAAPPAQPASGAQPAPQAGFKWPNDPVLKQIEALNAADIASARASADEQRWQLLLGFGNQELARRMFGDDPRVGAVSADPDKSLSILARLARGYRENQAGLNEDLNKQNLFYSTYRGKQLGELAQQRQTQEYDATGAVNRSLGDITSQLTAFIRDAKLRELQANAEARDRAINEALQYGYGTEEAPAAFSADRPLAPAASPGYAQPYKPRVYYGREDRLR